MRNTRTFFTSIRNNLIAVLFFLLCWLVLSFFYPKYIIPSPLTVFSDINGYAGGDFAHHFWLTMYRTLIGFLIAFFGGFAIGIFAFLFSMSEYATMVLVLFQVIPGTILGIIFLLLFGIGNGVPIALVAALTLPTVSINTSQALIKRNRLLEGYISSVGGTQREIVRDLYVPTLIPTIKSNISLGFSLALKVVVLGEFIGSQDGIGYLLNVAKVYFQMDEVFFQLFVLLAVMVVVELVIAALFASLFSRFLLTEG